MTTEVRAPVAIRISRPYATEDEYLEHELDTLTRASVTLVGAPPRPEGALLRFELALSSGQVILRGEGRVTGFKANVMQGMGGLALRFTRLDMRSKALVDKAAALREMRRPSIQSPGAAPPAGSSLVPAAATVLSAALQPSALPIPAVPPPAAAPPSAPPPAGEPTAAASSTPPPPSSAAPGSAPASPSAADPLEEPPPPGREALLARLRERAKTVDPAMVRRLLAARSSS